ncbi:MAG: hypothetical protein ACR2PW_03260 [Gammaproteobacteria bacterium]
MDDLLSVLSLILVLFIGIAGTLAFRIKFDVNAFLERRDKKRIKQLQFICPHVRLYWQGDQVRVTPLMQSPFGALQWQCRKCGYIDHTDFDDAYYKGWLTREKLYLERMKKIEKIFRKLGFSP